jgi:hypothetical protein
VTVTINRPDGTSKTVPALNIREAGAVIAYALHYNTGISRKDATRHAMTAEKTGTVSAEGYTFTIEKG